MMNLLCLFRHRWRGCRCERCGQTRDRRHDWDHCRCRRCWVNRHSDHDWQGCVCRVCGAGRHHWEHGVCAACGFRCTHEDQPPGQQGDTGMTAHSSRPWHCAQCGLRLG